VFGRLITSSVKSRRHLENRNPALRSGLDLPLPSRSENDHRARSRRWPSPCKQFEAEVGTGVSTSCCKGCSRARPAHRPRPDATVRLSQRRRIDLNEELQLDLERETERPAGERPVAGRRV